MVTQAIENDAYLIIVWNDKDEEITINDYPPKVAATSQNLLNQNITNPTSKSNIQAIAGRLAMAGYTSSIAQNFASKKVPSALLGRLNSSVYDIMSDGKISNAEVADDFVRSCTNALDTTAIKMGFPSASTLYNAIKPDGSGILSKDFGTNFSQSTQQETEEEIIKKNDQSTNALVLKFKLITGDNETWGSSIPVRSTENGINLVSNIQNDNISKDLDVYIVNNEKKGIDVYDIKAKLKRIRDSKKTFDVYINDSDLRKQEVFKNCLFESLSVSVEGKNALKATFNLSQIPEWSIKTQQLPSGIKNVSSQIVSSSSGSKIVNPNRPLQKSAKKNSSNIQNNVKTKAKTTVNKKNPMNASTKDLVNVIKDNVDSKFRVAQSRGKTYNPLNDASLQQRTKMNTGYTLQQLGVTATSSGKRY